MMHFGARGAAVALGVALAICATAGHGAEDKHWSYTGATGPAGPRAPRTSASAPGPTASPCGRSRSACC